METREKNNLNTIHTAYSNFMKSVPKNITPLFICVGGSRCYGTFREDSDTDIRGAFVAEPKHYLGLSKIEQVSIQREGEKETDTLMELRKFLELALANNPNVVEMLFVRPDHMLCVNPLFEPFLENRHLFLSKKCKHSYSGYAFSQLKRIQGHYDWLENPPEEPKQENYSVTRYRHKETGHIIPECDYLAKEKRIKAIANSGNIDSKDKTSFFEDLDVWEKIQVVDKGSWDKALDKYKQYQTWRKNRNEDRAKLEAEFSYDVKHASHLVRLLLQGRQILKEHSLDTYLREEELKIIEDVKTGKYTYPELIQYADNLNKELEDLYVNSTLRNSPDRETIESVCVDVLNQALKIKGLP